MADLQHLDLLRRGTDTWNTWRSNNPTVQPDLSGANLSGAILSKVNLSGAILRQTSLIEAILSEAYLGGGILREADLSGADLSGANLRGADLRGANLSRANLSGADLSVTILNRADLSWANLSWAHLNMAILNGADLSRSNLRGTVLNMAILNDTILNEAHFYHTTFAWVDLSHVKGLETAIHGGPSSVDTKSVTLPHDEDIRRHFLCNAGFSDTFIDYLPSLLTIPIRYHSLFLSYSHHDQSFTNQLYNDLQKQGVRCWFAPHDLYAGTPIVCGIEEATHLHEKLLLVLSQHAISSNWVQQEVEVALYKEVATGEEILFPIRLDNTVLESDAIWAKRLRQREIGDLTGWQDKTTYHQAFTTLLQHLKVTSPIEQ
jgi:uncharacterized protein YjbI with pentapeptide repeats